jgi:hypothetical protein
MAKAWLFLIGACCALATISRAAGTDRFSQALDAEERRVIGIDRLTSDQVAILDALVRRDLAGRSLSEPATNPPTVFSQRLSADERRNAGVAGMTDDGRRRLDAAVARYQSSGMSQSLMTPPVFLPRNTVSVRPREKKGKPEREVHGSFTLAYGWGDGYSTRSGSMVVNMTDPEKKYSITIGYGETHVKGNPGPGILLDRGSPYYGPLGPGDLLRP